MSTEENKKLVHRFYEEWNRDNLDGIAALLADEVIDHNPLPGQQPGKKGMVEGLRQFFQAFPGIQITVDRMLADGNKVFVTGRARGTHRGTFAGIPATNKPVDFTFSDIYWLKNGRVAEVWHIEDSMTMMQQIGVMPQLGAQPPTGTSSAPTTRRDKGQQPPAGARM